MRLLLRSTLLIALGIIPLLGDQITLKNGDRVTGAIVKKDGKDLTVKSDLMGVVTIPWDQVTEVKSGAPLNVVLSDRTVQATIESNNGQVRLITPQGAAQSVPPADIVAIRDTAEQTEYERKLHPGWLQLWTGTATLGLSGARGNARTATFTTTSDATRSTNHDVTSLYFKAVKASATVDEVNSDTAQAIRGGWKYGRKLGSRLTIDTFNDYEYDRFQNLDLRFVIGGGIGYSVWKSDRGFLALQGGADYNHEKFSASPTSLAFSRSNAEFYYGDQFAYKLAGAIDILQNFRMFSNLSDTGNYRINFDITMNTKIHKWLVWNLGISDRYLSNPVIGTKPNDILYTTGLGVTFGH
jgi:putative salt-induced outer membrane protein YdiY